MKKIGAGIGVLVAILVVLFLSRGDRDRNNQNIAHERNPSSMVDQNTKSNQNNSRAVYFNRKKLDDNQLNALESTYQTQIQDGKYWYDALSGSWGKEGGPVAGFIMAGLNLPGPMPADISGRGTNVFINNREIHPIDFQGLQQLFGVVNPGRYWLDAQGNLGNEGGPAVANLAVAMQNSQRQQGGGSVTHGYGSTYGSRGTLGSDGEGGSIYSGTDASGKSVIWFPGM